MSHRLFVGIDLPDDIRDHLHGLQGGVRGARWVASENLHLTLRFIGAVNATEAADIDAALAGVRARGFELVLDDAGAFASNRRARVIWAGVVASRPLAELKARVDAALAGAGLGPDDRKFSPHITLARMNSAAGPDLGQRLAEIAPAVVGRFAVDALTLFESHLAANGAEYDRVGVYPLLPP